MARVLGQDLQIIRDVVPQKPRFSPKMKSWFGLLWDIPLKESESPVLPGEYQDAPGQQACMRCAAGTYQDRLEELPDPRPVRYSDIPWIPLGFRVGPGHFETNRKVTQFQPQTSMPWGTEWVPPWASEPVPGWTTGKNMRVGLNNGHLVLPFPLPHRIWALSKWASMYVVYMKLSTGLMFPSPIQDSPLELNTKSAQKRIHAIIQVDLPWDASSLEGMTIQCPEFTGFGIAKGFLILCAATFRESPALQGWERPNCLQVLPSWYQYSWCWQLACRALFGTFSLWFLALFGPDNLVVFWNPSNPPSRCIPKNCGTWNW